MLIGVTGYAQNGKDTTGTRLVEKYGFEQHAFADQLRALALDINPWVPWAEVAATLTPEELLPHPVSEVASYAGLVKAFGYERAKDVPTVRNFLVALGIGVREHVDPDAWVDALDRVVRDVPSVVVTDVRFPNEAQYVRQNGMLMRVSRRQPGDAFDFEAVPHDSPAEMYIASLPVDQHLIASSVEELVGLVDFTVETWGVQASTSALASADTGSIPVPSTEYPVVYDGTEGD